MMLFWVSTVVLNNKVFANGLVISNTSLTGQNTSAQTWQVRFNVTWNNSWRDNINWDAVWIFCKYRVGTNAWGHATLSPTGFQVGNGTPVGVQVACDQKGAFISRRDLGNGTVNTTQLELRWNYGADGVANTDVPDLNIYGMEMVYIPTGTFTIGDGNGVNSSAGNSFYAVSAHLPYTIDELMSPNISATGNMTNSSSNPPNHLRIDGDNGIDLNLDGVVDSAFFPLGYKGFYIMKYKVTQGQYVDFLNSLTYAQQTNRVNNATNTVGASAADGSSPSVNPTRNTIIVQVAGTSPNVPRVYSTSRPDRANNYVSSADMMAYLDWAALRPMTELEYEKAARGPLAPQLNDRIWGSAGCCINTSITLTGTENGTETGSSAPNFSGTGTVSQGDGGSGPVRVGIYATASSNSRGSSGNSYYGVVNFGDNLGEFVVTIGNVAGRSFNGSIGDGVLHINGHANQSTWPGANGNSTVTTSNTATNTNGSTNSAGLMFKAADNFEYVSSRSSLLANNTTRQTSYGIRGVRDAFTADWTRTVPTNLLQNLVLQTSINITNRFTASQIGAGITYNWSFPSGTPSSSTSRVANVNWATSGTYNVGLTVTQGTCSATTIQPVTVLGCTVLASNTIWTQDNSTYRRGRQTASRSNIQTLDGIVLEGNNSYNDITAISNVSPGWIVYDLASAQTLNTFWLYSHHSASGTAGPGVGNFRLLTGTSLSGPWTEVYSGVGSGARAWQNFTFPSATARYWRIEVSSGAPNPNNWTTGFYIQEVAFGVCQ
jgi:formylglycine-generating enzyme required for sulfatase activity